MSGTDTPVSVGRPADRRKLVAVVYADMVGYSRLIGLDDIGTLERLRTLRNEVIDPAIDEHGGSIVQTGGDFLLVAFDSIDGAVRCAMKVQQQVRFTRVASSPIGPYGSASASTSATQLPMEPTCMATASTWQSGFRPSARQAASASPDRCAIMCTIGSIWPLRSLGRSG